ncbi:catenin delta-2-like isoform X10 [Penaeus chinensis]|uniref:catenin delta-2-like isoform X10 n=2 Tax=Penaeus chinensis TaxID=139456 RepID=UPI001FB7FC28|nr:catenin delta-2-like isoform X10 [Penaeus chinensis]
MTDTFGEPEVTTTTTTYSVDYGPQTTNGHLQDSPDTSRLSVSSASQDGTQLVSRKQTHHTTQQITTTTKVIRELHHIGPDGKVVEYPAGEYNPYNQAPSQPGYAMDPYRPHSPASEAGKGRDFFGSRSQYEGYPPTSNAGYEYDPYSRGPPPRQEYPYGQVGYSPQSQAGYSGHYRDAAGNYVDPGFIERPPTPPSPSERSESPPPHRTMQQVGGYPQSGYAELDGALLPPNGQDPYRNTPSPGLHGLPQDRYDGGLEGEGHAGDYPEDGRYPAAESAMVYPPEGVVYGRLLGAPRSPYTINGSVGASAEPLLPSPGMYDEEPPHVQHPAPLPHMSPPTPSLPPPPIQNHDNYAHPNLLRSPSADSGAPRVRWRDPDLHEVIDFLSNPNNVVKANAAAYLQHLCYMDDPTKQKTRILGGIPPLVALLTHDLPELHRNACGALRNLSYGRQNDENKRAIRDASGIPSLVRLLRKTPDNEVKELVTGILWNLSSCEDLKHNIIDDALTVIVSHVIIPCSGWDGGDVERDPNVDVWWSTVFKNASGVLRNISSAGEYARTKLRQCNGLVDSLLTVIKSAIQGSSHDNKSVENCVCILRNLSYRCQEVEDPNYDKNQPPTQSRATATAKDGEGEGTDTCGRSSEPKDNLCDNLGCFGGSRKKKEAVGGAVKETSTGQRTTGPRTEPLRGMELLWQPEVVVSSYLALLSDCSNPETLEAAAGALQNLAACYWQPSIDVRAAVRKEKGLPILVELLRMEVDRVVCAVATALRNLAIDQRNKELIGKYAMRDLVQKLPSGNTHDSGTSDETIAAVLATLNEVIKKSAEFSRSLLDVGGVERLVNMTRHRGRYSVRVVKFASQVLFSMWGHQELREVYKKAGWKEQDFVSKSVAARNAAGGGANSPTANNTLNRPMASQGGTRYEDRTIQRGQGKAHHQYNRGEEVPMANMGYSGDGGVVPPAGGVRLYPPMQGKPGEPVYAKVNRDKKRNRQYDSMGPQYGTLGGADDWGGPVYSGSPAASPNFNNSPSMNNNNSNANNNNNNGILLENAADGQAGDSWV